MVAAYLFEIRQIQSYVFSTGKLRDASGASELIDAISGDGGANVSGLAGLILQSLNLPTEALRTYRAAGGVLNFCCDDQAIAARFRGAFRLALSNHAPGLVYNDTIATAESDSSARDAARNSMSDAGPVRGLSLPLGSPIVRPAPRSGGSPAFVKGWTDKNGRCGITGEYADLPTLACRRYLRHGTAGLAWKFVAESQRTGLRWPEVFSADEDNDAERVVFPFGERSLPRIAVLHADGNGMGALYAAALAQLDSDEVRALSQDLTRATREAVQTAMGAVVDAAVQGVMPARPILLGGDDVTLILRADLVADFVVAFVRAYETLATQTVHRFDVRQLDENQKRTEQPWPKLTTKIGFVVIGPNQPFLQAYRLAEDLAKAARDPFVSRVAFYRVTGAEIAEDASALADQGQATKGFTLWRAAHGLEDFERLRRLATLMEDDNVGRGGLRRVPESLKTDKSEAMRLYERALVIVSKRAKGTCEQLVDLLDQLGFDGSFEAGSDVDPIWCPLLAAHDLAHVLRGQTQ